LTQVFFVAATERSRKMENADKLLRMKQVLEVIPVAKSTIWQWVKEDRFPKPIKLGGKTTVWKMSEIQRFVETVGV
jgi:prophage regulatory protein